jgi:hypothetical protein
MQFNLNYEQINEIYYDGPIISWDKVGKLDLFIYISSIYLKYLII